MSPTLPALLALFVAAASGAFAARHRAGRWALLAPALPLAVTVGLVGTNRPRPGGTEFASSFTWIDTLDVRFALAVDGYGWLFTLIIGGIGLLVLAYAAAYFDHAPSALIGRFAALFALFTAAMLGIVWASDIWTLFISWELTSICSFLLIAINDHLAEARSSALRALLTTGAGGLAMMGGFALLASASGSTDLASIPDAIAVGGTRVDVALALVLIGAATKSAQIPFHYWLPGAMAAPTPVSAFLHSATMVKAGVVLVARLAPAASHVEWWTPTLICLGGATMLWGGARALRQIDAKLILAFGTVSQLGFLMVLFGIGDPETTAAGVAMLLAHSLFKAALFMVVGLVDHAAHSRDIRRLRGLATTQRPLAVIAAIAGASMAGIPPLLGFVSKESALAALDHLEGAWAIPALALVTLGSILTAAYTLRFWFGVFGDATDPAAGDPIEVEHRVGPGAVAPAALLAALTILGGLAAGWLEGELDVAATALDDAAHLHLTLWAGVHLPLILSGVIVAAGTALWWFAGRATPGPMRWPVTAERSYESLFDAVIGVSKRTTARVQNGSLPWYLLVGFTVLASAMAIPAIAGRELGPVEVRLADSWAQLTVGAVAAVLGLAVALARRRFAAVLLLGGVGYSLALIYLFLGAPDLALTQLVIETISTVMFLLVLRHLPSGYRPASDWLSTPVKVAAGVAAGAALTVALVVVGTANDETPAADTITELSYPEAAGRNVVNVILVDFRGFDTMGEITVLALGALGVANLVRGARRSLGLPTLDESGASVGSAGPRSVVLDVVTRALFPVMLVVGIYVTFHGHNAPGGGFAGGLIASAAALLRYLSGGPAGLRRSVRISPLSITALGLLLAALTAASGLIGGDLLESGVGTVDAWFLGEIKIVSSTFFDLGVFLTVVGVVLSMLVNLGSEDDATAATNPAATPAANPVGGTP